MIPRILRLDKNAIQITKKEGQVFEGELLSLLVYNRKDSDPSRYSVVVSKKISDKSVVRNEIKRKIFRYVGDNLNKVNSGWNIFILAKRQIVKNNNKIDIDLDRVFKNTSLIK